MAQQLQAAGLDVEQLRPRVYDTNPRKAELRAVREERSGLSFVGEERSGISETIKDGLSHALSDAKNFFDSAESKLAQDVQRIARRSSESKLVQDVQRLAGLSNASTSASESGEASDSSTQGGKKKRGVRTAAKSVLGSFKKKTEDDGGG